MIRYVGLMLGMIFCQIDNAQNGYDKSYFSKPLDIEIKLAGNFGELRNNHFHTGIDIKTLNKEGLKVNAVADGYVSRIKISPYGYGKALYITHPNGYVSVYAHLKSFNDSITAFARAEQYRLESFEIDVFPQKGKLKIKKGDYIALSGNTGGSSGPHLHFEIREEQSEKAINPLLWGFDVTDAQKPTIKELGFFPIDINSRLNGKNNPLYIKVININGTYKIPGDTIFASGKTGIGIEGFDTEGASSNHNGIFSIELVANGKRIYFHQMEKLGFDELRYINCHIDYPGKMKLKKSIQRSYLLKNNKLGIYQDIFENGVLTVDKDSIYKMQYTVKDFSGNISTIKFIIKGNSYRDQNIKTSNEKYDAVFHFADTNKFETADIKIVIPPGILYEDMRFSYGSSKCTLPGILSVIHKVHNELTPVHSYYKISLKCPEIPESLKEKVYITAIDEKGKRSNEGGNFETGFVTTKTKHFGRFAIAVDTIAPVIKPENIYNNKVITSQRIISFKVSDDQTGIKEYRGTIDGKWVIFEYDAKNNRLFYEKSELPKGKHQLSLEVRDDRKNTTVYNATIIQ